MRCYVIKVFMDLQGKIKTCPDQSKSYARMRCLFTRWKVSVLAGCWDLKEVLIKYFHAGYILQDSLTSAVLVQFSVPYQSFSVSVVYISPVCRQLSPHSSAIAFKKIIQDFCGFPSSAIQKLLPALYSTPELKSL